MIRLKYHKVRIQSVSVLTSLATDVDVHTSSRSTAADVDVDALEGSNRCGSTYGQRARKLKKHVKGKLTVEFNFTLMQAICDNAEMFNNEIGYIVRKNCSFQYKEWRCVPSIVRAPLRHKLLTVFDINIEDRNVQKVIDKQMQRAWKGHKYKLHAYFKEIGGKEDLIKAKSKRHEEVSQEDWDYLCDLWTNPIFMERAQKNADSRAKRKWESRNGSRSTARHHVIRGANLDASTRHIETWHLRHWHSEHGWSSPELEAKYEQMMQLRRDNPPDKMTDKDILEKVLGRQSVRLFGWGRSPSTSGTTCTSEESSRPTYNELVEDLNQYKFLFRELQGDVNMLRQVLIEKNIMPPPSTPHVPSDHSSGRSPVEHYTQVKLKKRGSDTKYVATVLAIGTECDIAMLTVENDEFWEGVSPLEFGELPALQDAVTVVGYPIGGDTISVTSGVVSRIEILSYVHGSTELLGLQIDAAINSGNSGGPAFNDKGNCVGIAFQSLKHEDVENIGYVIPTPVIMHFIQDYEKNGAYTGFPILGVEWQKMENPDMRMAMEMKPDQKGVRIRRIDPTAPESEVLKSSDIVLSFDGIDIANDGTVPFRHGERIGFSYLVSQKYTGDVAAIKVLRNSKTLKFNVKLKSHKRLVPAHNKGRPPSYYIIAGLVFTTVSVPYLRSEYGKEYEYEAPVKLLDKLLHEMPQSQDEQLVVISQVLVADINIGYEEIVNTQVLAFNGQPVKNLKSLASMVESCDDEFLKFDLEYQQIVVLRTKAAKAATLDILTTHCIPSAMSDDLKS